MIHLSQDQESKLSSFPDSADIYADWSKNGPMPSNTVYTEIEVYVDGDRILRLEGDEIPHAQEIESSMDEITIWANGEVVWLKVENSVILDRTELAPLSILGGVS